jgi:ABC-type glycerol-3-phosphate transport system substrate-binding protein
MADPLGVFMRKLFFLPLICGIVVLTSCAPRPDKTIVQSYLQADPSNREVLFAFQAGRQLQELWSDLADRFSRENPWGITVIPRNYGFAADPALELEKTDLPGLVLTGLDWGTLPLSSGVDLFPLLAHPEWGVAWEPKDEIRRQYLVKNDRWQLPFLPLLRDANLLYVNLSSRAIPEDPRAVWEEGEFVFSLDEASLSTVHFALGGRVRDRKGEFREDKKNWDEAKGLISLAMAGGLALPETEKFQGQIDFTSGKVPVSMDTLSGLAYYRRSLDAFGASFTWDAVVYPYDRKRGGMNLWDLGVQIADAEASDVLASWLFYKWLMGPEIQAELADATGLLPVNPGAASLLASQSDPVYLRVLEEYLTAPRQTYPRTGGSGDYLKSLVEDLRIETNAGF